MSRTISDGSIDLDKFPVSRVSKLAKKLESLKATVRHIKQVSSEPHVQPKSIYYMSPEDRPTKLRTQVQKEKVSCKTQTG